MKGMSRCMRNPANEIMRVSSKIPYLLEHNFSLIRAFTKDSNGNIDTTLSSCGQLNMIRLARAQR